MLDAKEILKQERLKSLFANFKTTLDDVSPDARSAAFISLLNKKLQDKNAVIELTDTNDLVLVRRDGMNVFGDDHRQWDVATLIRHALNDNKILIEENKPTLILQQQNTKVQPEPQPKSKSSNVLTSLVNRSLDDLEKSKKYF